MLDGCRRSGYKLLHTMSLLGVVDGCTLLFDLAGRRVIVKPGIMLLQSAAKKYQRGAAARHADLRWPMRYIFPDPHVHHHH